jgi:glycosyltransferase involved in cell wall biosynthesis
VNQRPTVSVVLIFYNDERFLPESIESVFAQTYTDWELILVDDGSTDGSTDIALGWAERFPGRVRYVDHDEHANLGASAARDLGARNSRGRYIATLDSDDVWMPQKLDEQVAILDANPDVGLVFGASLYWWSWGDEDPSRADRHMTIGAPGDRIYRPPALASLLYPLGRGVNPCPSSWMMRRDLVESLGGFEEHLRPIYEDQAFLAKAYLATPVWVSARCWDRYRLHPGQVTQTTSKEGYHEARRGFLAWYEGYIEELGLDDPAVRRALNSATWPYRYPKLAAVRRSIGRTRARLRRFRPKSPT